MKVSKVRLGLIQMAAAGDPAENLERAFEKIEEAHQKGARMVCLQELFRSRYFCQQCDPRHFELAETIPGPTTRKLSEMARRKNLVVIAPLFEKRVEGIYHNSAVVVDADGILKGIYRKMHIPDDPCFCEKFYFTPGDLGFVVFETRYARIGVLICWDQWFPEAARIAALKGAQILFYPTAIGWHEAEPPGTPQVQIGAWETVQRGHAIANEVFLAVTNRVGKEGPVTFWGRSFAADPFGRVLARAGDSEEENVIVDCDLSLIEETRRNWPFFRDRRADAYGEIGRQFLEGKEAT